MALPSHAYGQEGLEVVTDQHSSAFPEVQGSHDPEAYHTEHDPHAAPQSMQHAHQVLPVGYNKAAATNGAYQPGPTELDGEAAPKAAGRRRLFFILGGVIAVLVILGAVLGGVLGSRAAAASSNSGSGSAQGQQNANGGSNSASATDPPSTATDTSATSSATSSATPIPTLKSVRVGSQFAATGWRGQGFFNIWMFYQGPDDVVRYSTYSSATDDWSTPKEITSIQPMAGTPMAAAANLDSDNPSVELYYLNSNSMLRGQHFREGETSSTGSPSDINKFSYSMDKDTKLSAFWPYVLSQNKNGTFRWHRNDYSAGAWVNESILDAAASAHTGMTILPTAVQYLDTIGFLYVDGQGELSTYAPPKSDTDIQGWGSASGSTNVDVPLNNTSIGAFAYARKGNEINTHVLFQNADQDIYDVYQDDDSNTWKGPTTHDALSGADDGTSIGCVMEGLWYYSNVNMSSLTDMTRCYYQSQNKIKEVWFDGDTWKDLGFLPMD